jgi:hypothetical protein
MSRSKQESAPAKEARAPFPTLTDIIKGPNSIHSATVIIALPIDVVTLLIVKVSISQQERYDHNG